jgi:hypothetical protein
MGYNIPQVSCVTYTDEFSNHNDSYVDLEIGAQHNIVASNGVALQNGKAGALVQIIATKKNLNKRRIQYVILERQISGPCRLWENAGPNGRQFKYHWTFIPLTCILDINIVIEPIREISQRMDLNIKNLYNSRLCGYGVKYIPLIHEVLDTRAIPLLN